MKLIVEIKEYGPAELTPFRDHRQNNKLITLHSGFFDLELCICRVVRRGKWIKDSEPVARKLVVDVYAAVCEDGAYEIFSEAKVSPSFTLVLQLSYFEDLFVFA